MWFISFYGELDTVCAIFSMDFRFDFLLFSLDILFLKLISTSSYWLLLVHVRQKLLLVIGEQSIGDGYIEKLLLWSEKLIAALDNSFPF
jgi:hypothetical protein